MRRVLVLAIAVLGFATSAFAQSVPRVDVSGGWQMLHGEDLSEPWNGWFGDVAVNVNRVVALVGNIDTFYETFDESGQVGDFVVNLRAETRVRTFLGGARLNLRTLPRIVPFVEVLGGPVHVSTASTTNFIGITDTTKTSETHSVLQIGGGATLRLSEVLGVRVAVANRRFFANGESSRTTRVAAGVALGF